MYVRAQLLSCVQLFVTSRTAARQAPLSMEFSRQGYWRGCHFLPQGIFLTQGSNLYLWHLLHWQADSFPVSHLGSLAMSAAAKLLQLCLTLCDPIDGSPPGSPIPGIL